MPTPPAKPKLRWWQFSLRKCFLLVTLFSVLAGFWRYREWGEDLQDERRGLYLGYLITHVNTGFDGIPERAVEKARRTSAEKVLKDFDRKNWLPMYVYHLSQIPFDGNCKCSRCLF